MNFSVETINTELDQFIVENTEEIEVELPKVIGQEQLFVYLPKYYTESIIVDDELSAESENPVQSKAIYEKIVTVESEINEKYNQLTTQIDSKIVTIESEIDENYNQLTTHINSKTSRDSMVRTIGEATEQTSGLLSPSDKSFIIVAKDLIGNASGDSDAFVDTVREVLSVFDKYPEGVTLTNALAGKIDTSQKGVLSGVFPMPASIESGQTCIPTYNDPRKRVEFRNISVNTPWEGNIPCYRPGGRIVSNDPSQDTSDSKYGLEVVNLQFLNKRLKEVNAFNSSGDYPNISVGRLSSSKLITVNSTTYPISVSGIYMVVFKFTNDGYGSTFIYVPSIFNRAACGAVCQQGSIPYQAIVSETDHKLRVQSLDGSTSYMTIVYVLKLV